MPAEKEELRVCELYRTSLSAIWAPNICTKFGSYKSTMNCRANSISCGTQGKHLLIIMTFHSYLWRNPYMIFWILAGLYISICDTKYSWKTELRLQKSHLSFLSLNLDPKIKIIMKKKTTLSISAELNRLWDGTHHSDNRRCLIEASISQGHTNRLVDGLSHLTFLCSREAGQECTQCICSCCSHLCNVFRQWNKFYHFYWIDKNKILVAMENLVGISEPQVPPKYINKFNFPICLFRFQQEKSHFFHWYWINRWKIEFIDIFLIWWNLRF